MPTNYQVALRSVFDAYNLALPVYPNSFAKSKPKSQMLRWPVMKSWHTTLLREGCLAPFPREKFTASNQISHLMWLSHPCPQGWCLQVQLLSACWHRVGVMWWHPSMWTERQIWKIMGCGESKKTGKNITLKMEKIFREWRFGSFPQQIKEMQHSGRHWNLPHPLMPETV